MPANFTSRAHRHMRVLTALSVLIGVLFTSGCAQLEEMLASVTSATNTSQQTTVDVAATVAALNQLKVAPKSRSSEYTNRREILFGEAWEDKNTIPSIGRNGCDTRNDILDRDLTNKTYKKMSKCARGVATGTLNDPYTGKVIQYKQGPKTSLLVQVDHVVALGNVWESGGFNLTQSQRIDIANDPINLYATDGPTNGGKSNSTADQWLPPVKSFQCTYVAAQVNVKQKYRLSVTSAEKSTMRSVLSRCGG